VKDGGPERLRRLGIGAAIGGFLLLLWSVHSVGLNAVLTGVGRVGFGFIVIVALGGARGALRTIAWRLCLEDRSLLPFRRAFAAYLAGGALGNVTPLGMLVSEPSKILLVRDRVAASASIPALAVENLFYGISVALMLATGTVGLLTAASLPASATRASALLLACVAGGVLFGCWVVATRRRIGTGVAQRLGLRTDRIGAIEDRVFAFAARHPDRVVPVALCEIAFHAAAVFEIWFALRLITGAAPPLLTAFALEYTNRAITIVFQFVPLWLGVDEAGTGFIAAALGLNPAAGVSLALARKGRIAFWTVVGLAFWWPRNKTPAFGVRNAGATEWPAGSSSPEARGFWGVRSLLRLRRKATTSSS
jgi:hypothetical protein